MHETYLQKDFLAPPDYIDFNNEWMRTPSYSLGYTSLKFIKTSKFHEHEWER